MEHLFKYVIYDKFNKYLINYDLFKPIYEIIGVNYCLFIDLKSIDACLFQANQRSTHNTGSPYLHPLN